MFKRLAAIVFIFACTSVAWAILGSTLFYRTYALDDQLKGRVASNWGTAQEQGSPVANYHTGSVHEAVTLVDGKPVTRTLDDRQYFKLTLQKSRVQADLHLDYRRKGLLWYSTYQVQFAGTYEFVNPDDEPREVTFSVDLPAQQAIYDNWYFTLNGSPLPMNNSKTETYATARVEPHRTAVVAFGYHSQGLDRWGYELGDEVSQIRDFQLRVNTDFKGFDFPENTLSPTSEQATSNGAQLDWNYANLVSGYKIGVAMPQKIQPGPLTGRISYFAPVSLLFFFFVMFILTTIRGIELHPMNYFFLAGAFFSFHLLMAYLVDHISIHAAFFICSAVSVFLVVSYLRLVIGLRFAAVEAGLAQLVYLVFFSYAFFFEGFTGLAITICAILSLFVAMQVTARIRWSEKFAMN
jgi:hypothetical protein